MNKPPLVYTATIDNTFQDRSGKQIWRCQAVVPETRQPVAECTVTLSENHARVLSLYVKPHLRRLGIGDRLLYLALEVAKDKDVYVEVDSFEVASCADSEAPAMTDKELRKFYLDRGFETVLGHPFSLVLRRKKSET